MRRITALCLAFLLLFACAACDENAAAPYDGAEPVETVDPHLGQVRVSDGMGGTMWVRDYENLERSDYDTACFGRDGEYITYQSDEHTALRGVDVSFYQGGIDWSAVAHDGVEFAIIRAGYRGSTEGGLNTDKCFEANYAGARDAGLAVGVYFFSQAISAEEAAEEAEYLLQLLGGRELDMPVFFDWENIGSPDGARTDGLDGHTITECCLAFCDAVMAAGYDAGVYFYRSLGYELYELDRLEGLTVWLAHAGSVPDFYYDFDIWQYSFTGAVSGIEGDTDINLWFVETPPQDTPEDEAAVQAARLYEDCLLSFTGGAQGVNLTDEQTRELARILGENGLCATDVAQTGGLTLPEQAESFCSGQQGRLELYEICYDGGLVLHALSRTETGEEITLTRVIWQQGEVEVTYSERYTVTEVALENGVLQYEYFMPDNPQGSNHDGHIDTEMSFRVY